MSGIHDIFKDDDVNGQIIGGEYVCGVLKYEGRQQGKQLYADSQETLKTSAVELKRAILTECGEASALIYPNDASWSLTVLQA